jgi:hypothetical protein
MAYGKIEYDSEGNPKCEICGLHFKRVLSHVRQKHDMNEREYKLQFGFDLIKGICSKESSLKTREKTLSNYDKCISRNLIVNGFKTRKVKGDAGRTKDMVSAQTKQMLKDRLKQPYMINALKKSGTKVGKSGLGNLKRWGSGELIKLKKTKK